MNNRETRAAIIRTSGLVESVTITSLSDMQEAVGGFIDCVRSDQMRLAEPLAPEEGTFEIYVNDEGLLHRLPMNLPVALSMGVLIHGDVLVTGAADDEGETTDLPSKVYDQLPRMLREPGFSFHVLPDDDVVPDHVGDGPQPDDVPAHQEEYD
tara:strand:- start:2424 stop:2882 length:459 start_codon:yes stop_codon:yes gene_type:complete